MRKKFLWRSRLLFESFYQVSIASLSRQASDPLTLGQAPSTWTRASCRSRQNLFPPKRTVGSRFPPFIFIPFIPSASRIPSPSALCKETKKLEGETKKSEKKMESKSKSKKNNYTKSSIPLTSPMKSPGPKPSASVSDQIATPEKPIHHPPRTRNRRMALSINEVKQIARGLQSNNRQPSDGADPARSDLDLLPVETPRPSRAKPHVKLPEK